MIPTKVGWYWFRGDGRGYGFERWRPMQVVEHDGHLVTMHAPTHWDLGYTRVDHFDAKCWGPRIEKPVP